MQSLETEGILMQNVSPVDSPVPDSEEVEESEDVEDAGTLIISSSTLSAGSHLHFFILADAFIQSDLRVRQNRLWG